MLKKPIAELSEVPGWFAWVDREAFRQILKWQSKDGVKGDLLEIGVYMGKSAIVVGDAQKQGETFTVVDLFEGEANDTLNAHEMNYSYPTLTQDKFEKYYLTFHKKLPRVIKGFSSEAAKQVKKSSCRFIHIDASHMYNHVVHDIADSRILAKKDAVVVCDDYRSEHTPGVAAAVWQAVANGFKPICITPGKFYGTWGDPKPLQAKLRKWVENTDQLKEITEEIAGYPITRIFYATNPKIKSQLELDKLKKELEDYKIKLENTLNSRTYKVARKASKAYSIVRKTKT